MTSAHRSFVARALQLAGWMWWEIVDRAFFLSTWPHFRAYKLNTYLPIQSIIGETDETATRDLTERWIETRKVEVKYVQVAGAVVFTSVISCLSWTSLEGRHWTGPALWYCSIVIAITSVVLGAQQLMVLENIRAGNWKTLQAKLRTSVEGAWRPKRILLFVWQAPLMALSYSMLLFLGGLTSFVASPLAQKRAWDGDAKTLVMFLTVLFLLASLFTMCSARIHALLRDVE